MKKYGSTPSPYSSTLGAGLLRSSQFHSAALSSPPPQPQRLFHPASYYSSSTTTAAAAAAASGGAPRGGLFDEESGDDSGGGDGPAGSDEERRAGEEKAKTREKEDKGNGEEGEPNDGWGDESGRGARRHRALLSSPLALFRRPRAPGGPAPLEKLRGRRPAKPSGSPVVSPRAPATPSPAAHAAADGPPEGGKKASPALLAPVSSSQELSPSRSPPTFGYQGSSRARRNLEAASSSPSSSISGRVTAPRAPSPVIPAHMPAPAPVPPPSPPPPPPPPRAPAAHSPVRPAARVYTPAVRSLSTSAPVAVPPAPQAEKRSADPFSPDRTAQEPPAREEADSGSSSLRRNQLRRKRRAPEPGPAPAPAPAQAKAQAAARPTTPVRDTALVGAGARALPADADEEESPRSRAQVTTPAAKRVAVTVSRSASAGATSTAAAPSRREAPALAADTRSVVDEVFYLVDGVGPAQPTQLRVSSALRLAALLASPGARPLARRHGVLAGLLDALRGAEAVPGLALGAAAVLAFYGRTGAGEVGPAFPPECAPLLVALACAPLRSRVPSGSPGAVAASLAAGSVAELDVLALATDAELPDPVALPGVASQALAASCLARAVESESFKLAVFQRGLARRLVATLASDVGEPGALFPDTQRFGADPLASARAHRVGRLLAAAEQLSHASPKFQALLLEPLPDGADLVASLMAVLRSSAHRMPRADQQPGRHVQLLDACRALVNLTHQNETACAQLNSGGYGIMLLFELLLAARPLLPSSFDPYALTLGVLINCAEHSGESRRMLLGASAEVEGGGGAVRAVPHLVSVFEHHYRRMTDRPPARAAAAGARGGGTEEAGAEQQQQQQEEEEQEEEEKEGEAEEDVLALEERVLASYAALLLACVACDSPEASREIRDLMPGKSLDPLVSVSREFILLQSDAQALTEDNLASVVRMLAILESREKTLAASTAAASSVAST